MHLAQLHPRGLLCVSLVSDLSRRVLTSLGASGASLPAAPPIPPTPTHCCWQYYTRHFNDQPPPPPSPYDSIYMTCSQNYQSRKWGDFFVLVFFHLCLFSWVSGHLAGWRFWRKWTGRVIPTPAFFLLRNLCHVGGGACAWRRASNSWSHNM